ncbi:unnamed protein product [Didymodactylos carnosus]|uniref:Uncharacterized protein n=1 Tax=Didymodactylos carnosus TaxID=1234261 RepID=A0A813Z5C9_9BILA|nr:unnamed protein product [Didymodactylos carnosus]CAF3677083.1 unnamed protein product [Didymodactylos carnosus]
MIRIKGVIIITLALLLGITALIFHFLAMFTKRWKVTIPKGVQNISNNNPHYYGLWERCQYMDISFATPVVIKSSSTNIINFDTGTPTIRNFVCRPNTYLRYKSKDIDTEICFIYRHLCSSLTNVIHPCTCNYLPSTKGLQWCCILAAIFMILGLLLLYLKLIAIPQHDMLAFLLNFTPILFIFFSILFMLTTLILIGAYLRRDEYEDYDVVLSSILTGESVNLYRLKQYFQLNKRKILTYNNEFKMIIHHFYILDQDTFYKQAIEEFKTYHLNNYDAHIGWSTGFEIIALVSAFLVLVLSLELALATTEY